MRFILLMAILLALLQQATAIPFAITLGNVSVQTDIPASGMASRWRSPHMEMASSHL